MIIYTLVPLPYFHWLHLSIFEANVLWLLFISCWLANSRSKTPSKRISWNGNEGNEVEITSRTKEFKQWGSLLSSGPYTAALKWFCFYVSEQFLKWRLLLGCSSLHFCFQESRKAAFNVCACVCEDISASTRFNWLWESEQNSSCWRLSAGSLWCRGFTPTGCSCCSLLTLIWPSPWLWACFSFQR